MRCSPNSANARAASRACSTISETIGVTVHRMWALPRDRARLSGHCRSIAEAVGKRRAAHIGLGGFRIFGGAAELVEALRPDGRVALLHQAFVGDGLGLDVFHCGVTALAA